MTDKIKAYTITPTHHRGVDSCTYREDGNTWRDVLGRVEDSLDQQFNDNEDEGKDGWEEIKLTVECKRMTQEELDELEEV